MNAPPRGPRRRRRLILALAGLLLAGGVGWLLAGPGCWLVREAARRAPPPAPEGRCASGSFRHVQGVGVLTLWGAPRERGYAHGRLLARPVLDVAEAVCGTGLLLSDPADYERKILPLMERFQFEPDDEQELRGLFQGVRDALGDRARLRSLGRQLRLEDLKALNTAGDWYRQACSSFAAWGPAGGRGHVWVGRNFDFYPTRAFFAHQMIVVHRRAEGKLAWATVSAPGLIGCITGLNQEGVFASVHDVYLPRREPEGGHAPRLLVLRRLMERCRARDLAAQALPVFRARRALFDNAVLLAAPVRDGTPPALVFEYDGNRADGGGVTVRAPADNGPRWPAGTIGCTNSFRKRAAPSSHPLEYRYGLMRSVLAARLGRGRQVDFEAGRKVMGACRLPITLHTVVADLDELDFWYAAGEFLQPPGRGDYLKLPLGEWLRR